MTLLQEQNTTASKKKKTYTSVKKQQIGKAVQWMSGALS